MSTMMIEGRKSANLGGGSSCTKNEQIVHLNASITAVVRKVFPTKTWQHLADLFGINERAAKYKLANQRYYTIDEVARLLQTDAGLEILIALMGKATPKWYTVCLRALALGTIRQRQASDRQLALQLEGSLPANVAAARRQLRGALDANQRLSATLERAEAALGLQFADVDRDGDPAASAGSRVVGRAVASRGGRRWT